MRRGVRSLLLLSFFIVAAAIVWWRHNQVVVHAPTRTAHPPSRSDALVSAIASDNQGNLYVAQQDRDRVLRVSPDGKISAYAGTGERGFSGDSGPALQARLSAPTSIALDPE